jgi:hypothetical protein
LSNRGQPPALRTSDSIELTISLTQSMARQTRRNWASRAGDGLSDRRALIHFAPT